ncbi:MULTISPECIES: DUF2637 domain-containing protein [unclassified Streptomyces]|uniref:DUF2637 domain-containing protein n=1 Tax=unclassified Streptomyces TaxID=2593676 RepID=UPI0022551AA8|nr:MULTISPECIES: DUF2637 domain-containing protein [unclassified Streptomyces]MCX4871077.1 DUF2637 domain-containing protein [Streptomyces sp. NBC_00906]MCX4902695.1 DUF2637 domain-containing protein [Streptomyces sp. NBC_00892]
MYSPDTDVPSPSTPAPSGRGSAPAAPATGETAGMQEPMTMTKTTAAPAADKEPNAFVPPARTDVPPREKMTPPAPGTAPRPWSARAMRWVIGVSIICAAVVAAIGFSGSYDAVRGLAEDHGFGWFSAVFPIGVDAGIVAMYGLDLVMVWRRMPKPLLRLIAHILTLATIVFNAASGSKPLRDDPLGALMHGVLPLLFVAVVEAVRHLIIRTNRLVLGAESDSVPLHRWILSPWPAWKTYRKMKLRGITSYNRVVEMDKNLDVYEAWLQHKHGRSWKKKAGATAMLPFQMAKYGLTVDEALDLPRKQQENADRRKAADEQRIADAAAAEEERSLTRDEEKANARIRRMSIDASVETAGHEIAAKKAAAQADARTAEATAEAQANTAAHAARIAAESQRKAAERSASAAERAAEREETAEKTAEEAAAEARTLAARRETEENRRKIAEATEATERSKKRAVAEKAEAERLEAERLSNIAQQREAERITAEAEAATAVARETAARAELAAQVAEDKARLSPRERAERKVARMILAAHAALPADQRPEAPDMYAVSLEQVGEAIGVSQTVAGQRRQAAADLIADGYTG